MNIYHLTNVIITRSTLIIEVLHVDELSKKYMDAMVNVSMLARFGCDVQHEVDVHTMSFDNSLSLRRYDRIVFNFPHAGSRFFGREFSSKAIE